MKTLLKLELQFFLRRPWFYIMLLAFLLLGAFTGSVASAASFPNTLKNSPFAITYILGYTSMLCLFTSSITAAQILFRERDANFSLILYTTPIKKFNYLASRFILIFCITAGSFLLYGSGFCFGKESAAGNSVYYGPFHVWHYIQPFLLFGIPNALFSSAIIFCVGCFSKNKLILYISGLSIYILYTVALLFSGSPLMAGGLPQSAAAIDLSAKVDPFGLSAFMQETMFWSSVQRNTTVTPLAGNMLFNRLLYFTISIITLTLTFKYFVFSTKQKIKRRTGINTNVVRQIEVYKIIQPKFIGLKYSLNSLFSYTKLDIQFVLKSVAFVLLLAVTGFMVSMEIYAEISKGIRLPDKYASSAVMVNTILETLPLVCLLIIIFYSSELVWRSKTSNFHLLENSTATNNSIQLVSKWLSLSIIIMMLTVWSVLTGIVFQLAYGYAHINWSVYGSLFFFMALPLVLSAGLLVFIQRSIQNKYAGLVISCVVVLLMTTSLGKTAGFKHPLLRFNAAYTGSYSEMNGWGRYVYSFGSKMVFGFAVTLILVLLFDSYGNLKTLRTRKPKFISIISIIMLVAIASISGSFIYNKTQLKNNDSLLNWQEQNERKYRPFQHLPQPTITDIKTSVNLYPKKNSYFVKAAYFIKNKTTQPIEKILIYEDPKMQLEKIETTKGKWLKQQDNTGYHWVRLTSPLQPGEAININFEFNYSWSAFNGHEAFNAIVENGSFMRISRYFPQLGYQSSNEITDPEERRKRNLGSATIEKTLEAPLTADAGFINLDMEISTSEKQIAIGIGELIGSHSEKGRNYFHYKTNCPVPFRFAISSVSI